MNTPNRQIDQKLTRINLLQAAFLLIFLAIFISCITPGSAKKDVSPNKDLPAVFLDTETQYPSDKYISAVGVGTDTVSAQKNALVGLSQQIQVHIDSSENLSETLQETTTESNTVVQNATAIKSNTKTKSKLNLQGVQYGESFENEKYQKIYIIAYINRQMVGQLYNKQIQDLNSKINTLVNQSKKNIDFAKYSLLLEAHMISQKEDNLYQQLQVISPNSAKTIDYNPKSTLLLSNELERVARNIPLFSEVKIKGNTSKNTENIIQAEIITLFNELSFSVNKTSSTTSIPYILRTNIIWNNTKIGDYDTVIWDLNMVIEKNSVAILSISKNGRTKGNGVDATNKLALHDIKQKMNTSVKEALLKQIKR